ncbi:MAG: helix-turn-helix domain-containing protein, partial [Dehalococcoidia bacterium]
MERDQPAEVFERIKQLRSRLGLSQARLAELLGVSEMSIIRWEHERARPSPSVWQRILRAETEGLEAEERQNAGQETVLQQAPATARANLATNLPFPATSFIGRHWELTELEHLIGAARLVTLTGPGGCGKTRLAMEVAARVAAGSRQSAVGSRSPGLSTESRPLHLGFASPPPTEIDSQPAEEHQELDRLPT